MGHAVSWLQAFDHAVPSTWMPSLFPLKGQGRFYSPLEAPPTVTPPLPGSTAGSHPRPCLYKHLRGTITVLMVHLLTQYASNR